MTTEPVKPTEALPPSGNGDGQPRSGPTFIDALREVFAQILPPQRLASTVDGGSPRLPAVVGPPLVPPIVDAIADSAKNNAEGLPRFASRCQLKANLLTTTSNTLAAVTGLAIWLTIEQSSAWWAKALVALAALVSAVLGFLPGIFHWSDNAATARRIGSEYGHLYGDVLVFKGQILDGTTKVSDDKIDKFRTKLESLKQQRQEINAYWK